MTRKDETPDELREIDRALSAIRFEPRASLGSEIEGRLRRGESPAGRPRSERPRWLWPVAAGVVLAAGVITSLDRGGERVTIDQCCYDLDGGGVADDGVLIVADRDERVHRLSVYEDQDRSKGFSPADILRFERGADPLVEGPLEAGLTTFQHCCLDYDGGGYDDDGLLIVGRPPDRVVMAAIYETRRTDATGDLPRFLLR